MSSLLPHRFLFRCTLPVRYDRKLPGPGKKLLGLAPEFALADFSALDKVTPFGELRLAWNEQGLGVAVEGAPLPARSRGSSGRGAVWIRTRRRTGEDPDWGILLGGVGAVIGK